MIIICEHCNTAYEVEKNDPDVIIEPWPHIVCKNCKHWIPLF